MTLPLLGHLAVILAAVPAASAPTPPLILTHVTVIDATGTPAQPDMALVIAGGRIAELAKTAAVRRPSGARVVDAAGKFLIPGLWDMHVHWYDEPSLRLFTVNGVTGVRIMFGYPLHLDWRNDLKSGKVLGPRLVLAGPVVDGPKAVWPDSIRVVDEDEGRRAVRSIHERGFDLVKVYHLLPRSAYFGIADEACKLGLTFGGHVPLSLTAGEASEAGQKTIEHLSGVSLACSRKGADLARELMLASQHQDAVDPALLLRFEVQAEDSYDAQKAQQLFARFVKNGTWQVPTLAVRQSHALLGAQTPVNERRLHYMPPALQGRWESRRRATFKKLTPEDFANFHRSLKKHLELVGAMHRAGVGMLAGTDTGALDCYPGFSLHDELELFVKAGLTPMEALQTATRNPAVCLNKLDDLGTIERGKLADLVLLDANPLDDIRNTTRIHAVFVNGRFLLRDKLAAMLAGVEAANRQRKDSKPPGAYSKYP